VLGSDKHYANLHTEENVGIFLASWVNYQLLNYSFYLSKFTLVEVGGLYNNAFRLRA
jgi:hypothetical protein